MVEGRNLVQVSIKVMLGGKVEIRVIISTRCGPTKILGVGQSGLAILCRVIGVYTIC